MYRKNRDLDKCFTTALNTFDYIILGVNGKNGLETILEGLKRRKTMNQKQVKTYLKIQKKNIKKKNSQCAYKKTYK